MSNPMKCVRCGSHKIEVTLQNDPFQYGEGENAPWLDAVIPVYHCKDCHLQFTLPEADDIKHNAVREYLKNFA